MPILDTPSPIIEANPPRSLVGLEGSSLACLEGLGLVGRLLAE